MPHTSLTDAFHQMTAIAGLDVSSDPKTAEQLAQDVERILAYVAQVKGIDTTGVTPLVHPIDLTQRLRADVCSKETAVATLEAAAPLFEDNVYLVPKKP